MLHTLTSFHRFPWRMRRLELRGCYQRQQRNTHSAFSHAKHSRSLIQHRRACGDFDHFQRRFSRRCFASAASCVCVCVCAPNSRKAAKRNDVVIFFPVSLIRTRAVVGRESPWKFNFCVNDSKSQIKSNQFVNFAKFFRENEQISLKLGRQTVDSSSESVNSDNLKQGESKRLNLVVISMLDWKPNRIGHRGLE